MSNDSIPEVACQHKNVRRQKRDTFYEFHLKLNSFFTSSASYRYFLKNRSFTIEDSFKSV